MTSERLAYSTTRGREENENISQTKLRNTEKRAKTESDIERMRNDGIVEIPERSQT